MPSPAASSAPATISSGARSPPRASTAMRITTEDYGPRLGEARLQADAQAGSARRGQPRLRRRRGRCEILGFRRSGRLGRVEPQRVDLAALVAAAGRADVVRPLGRAALRADVDARRLEGVRRAALVAPGLGGLLLGDSHSGRPL